MSTAALRLEPVLLLFAAGSCIGLIFPLGRLAGEAGVPPLLYAAASAFGASLVLFAAARLSGSPAAARKGVLTYALVAGQLTFAIPFGMLVAVIPHLGSGIPAILQSLAPIITLAIVATLGLERPSLLRLVGLASGLAGAVLILISRNSGSFGETAPAIWYVAALTTPLALAAGNVFRTVAWPQAEKPLPLAAVTWASEPDWYASSPIARRAFCSACGTPLGFRFNENASGIDLTLGSFDDPSAFVPTEHAGAESLHEAWLDTRALPRQRSDEIESVVSRWHAAGREVPE